MTSARGSADRPAVEGMTIIVDSREQAPWDFSRFDVPTVVQGLPTGDYSLAGLEHVVAIERKSPEDLLGCIGRSRGRFERELERLAGMRFAAVVCEEPWVALTRGCHRSRLRPESIVGTLLAWSVRLPIHWHFAPGRSSAEAIAFGLLRRCWLDHRDGKGLWSTAGPAGHPCPASMRSPAPERTPPPAPEGGSHH